MLWSRVKLWGLKKHPKTGDYPPISTAKRSPAMPCPKPPLHEAKPGFSQTAAPSILHIHLPTIPLCPKPPGHEGLRGGCPDRDSPTCGSKPQTFRAVCLTPMPQSPLQQLLHFPFPPRASCLSRSIPGPRRRAVICQAEVGEKRNTLPKKNPRCLV